MKILTALVLKLAFQLAVLGVLLPPVRGSLFVVAFIVWLASFGVGDLFLVPLAGPLAAAVGDAVLVGALLMVLTPSPLTGALLTAAVVIAAGEYFFHLGILARGIVRHSAT